MALRRQPPVVAGLLVRPPVLSNRYRKLVNDHSSSCFGTASGQPDLGQEIDLVRALMSPSRSALPFRPVVETRIGEDYGRYQAPRARIEQACREG